MGLWETIVETGGTAAIEQAASKLGLGADTAKSAVSKLLPAISAGIKRNLAEPEGLTAILDALDRKTHGKYLDRPESVRDDATVEDGDKILGHVLGSKDASRAVAAKAAEDTGVDAATLKKLLPVVAALAMGGLSKKRAQSAPSGDATSSGGGGALESLTSMLDSDDVTALLGKLF
jgi:hypothetical protein